MAWDRLFGTISGTSKLQHQNGRGVHTDKDNKEAVGSIATYTLVTPGYEVLQGGTYVAPLAVKGGDKYLVVPSNTSALVAFHEHQHFGASIVPRPGMDYPSLDASLSDDIFDGIGAIDLSIVAQINGGVATSQAALQFAQGHAFTTSIVQNKYLVKLGLVMANTEERKTKSIADLPINKAFSLPNNEWTAGEKEALKVALDKFYEKFDDFLGWK